VHGRCEIGSHADTIVAGSNCILLHYTGKECDVSPYCDDYEAVSNVLIVNTATAWQSPISGQTYIFVLNKLIQISFITTAQVCRTIQCPSSHCRSSLLIMSFAWNSQWRVLLFLQILTVPPYISWKLALILIYLHSIVGTHMALLFLGYQNCWKK